jgi:hypothetical protein
MTEAILHQMKLSIGARCATGEPAGIPGALFCRVAMNAIGSHGLLYRILEKQNHRTHDVEAHKNLTNLQRVFKDSGRVLMHVTSLYGLSLIF